MQVKVEQGIVEGIDENSIYKFLGIPYAEPPIKDLRWREPLAPKKWKGVFEAKVFGPACPQKGGASFNLRTEQQSEDCLYMNVWTNDTNKDAQQPVMVWIHGGGNLGGAGSEDAFDGAKIAEQGITVVTFNYRLGAFGFIAHPEIGCNFAVLDQVAALEWIAHNIESFGGDPNNVTIFGESAGALAVRTLLSVSRARGLFHRAIIQSAGFEPYVFAAPPSYDNVRKTTVKMFESLGSSDLSTLQQIPTDEVLASSHKFSGVFPPPGQVHTPANLIWNPVPDGDVVAKKGFPGCDDNVPILIGCVENEARYFIKHNIEYGHDTLSNMVKALSGDVSAQVFQLLNKSKLTTYEALDKLFSTAVWFEPSYATVKRFEQLGHKVYYYHFARVAPGARQSGELAKHTAEIRYVFGNLPSTTYYDEADINISDEMQHAWIAFARKGVPESQDGSLWPSFNSATPYITVIKEKVSRTPLVLNELTKLIHSLRN